MPARCASPIAAPPWRRSTRRRSGRAAKGELQIVREANFVAFVSPVESVAQAAAAAAPAHAKWDNARRSSRRSRKRRG